jgi:hypothetical protein
MKNWKTSIVGVFAVIASLFTVAVPPAQAANNTLYHRADDGYDPAIIVHNGTPAYLVKEGESSQFYTANITGIYMRSGEALWCKVGATWYLRMTSTGLHNLPAGWSDGDGCTLRLD